MTRISKTLIVFIAGAFLFTGLVIPVQARDLVFGLTGRDMTPPYARAMDFGAERMGKKLGIKIVSKDSQNDILKQLSHMDSFLVMKVDGLVFEGTIDTAAVIPGIKKFNEKGIPLLPWTIRRKVEKSITGYHLILRKPPKKRGTISFRE